LFSGQIVNQKWSSFAIFWRFDVFMEQARKNPRPISGSILAKSRNYQQRTRRLFCCPNEGPQDLAPSSQLNGLVGCRIAVQVGYVDAGLDFRHRAVIELDLGGLALDEDALYDFALSRNEHAARYDSEA
jgi:hypothetical protein